MAPEPENPPDTPTESAHRWRIPLWPVALLLILGLLAWDWMPYFRMLQVRRDFISKCVPGKPFAAFAAEAKAAGNPTIDHGTGEHLVNLDASHRIPYTLDLALLLQEKLNRNGSFRSRSHKPFDLALSKYAFWVATDANGNILRYRPYLPYPFQM